MMPTISYFSSIILLGFVVGFIHCTCDFTANVNLFTCVNDDDCREVKWNTGCLEALGSENQQGTDGITFIIPGEGGATFTLDIIERYFEDYNNLVFVNPNHNCAFLVSYHKAKMDETLYGVMLASANHNGGYEIYPSNSSPVKYMKKDLPSFTQNYESGNLTEELWNESGLLRNKRSLKNERPKRQSTSWSKTPESNRSMAEISINYFYTPEVESYLNETNLDVVEFLTQQNAEMNDIVMASDIPIHFNIHCIREFDLPEKADMYKALDDITHHSNAIGYGKRNDNKYLMNSADVSVLFTSESWSSVCGLAWVLGNPTGVVNAKCAKTYPVLTHEVGHILGAIHGRHQYKSPSSTNYNYGYLIPPPGETKWKGYHTLMAYPTSYYYNVVLFFSNPDIRHDVTGNPIGDSMSNNAKAIRESRFIVAAKGDESKQCGVRKGLWEWSSWSCPVSCGTSPIQLRFRSCTGSNCNTQRMTEVKEEECGKSDRWCEKQNGNWSNWDKWIKTNNCDSSGCKRIRYRTCTNPPPRSGGRICEGSDSEQSDCKDRMSGCDGYKTSGMCEMESYRTSLTYYCSKTCEYC